MTSRSLSAAVLFLTLVVGIVLTSSLCVQGQSTYGSVSGAVTDASGAAVVGAQVTLTNTGTSEKHTQTTNDQGTYSFVNVIPGEYRLDIEKTGFKHYAHPMSWSKCNSIRTSKHPDSWRCERDSGGNVRDDLVADGILFTGTSRGATQGQRTSLERPKYFQFNYDFSCGGLRRWIRRIPCGTEPVQLG